MRTRSVVTSKGQVTIPKGIREALQVKEADVVEFEVRPGEVVVRRVQQTFMSRFGSVPPRQAPEPWKRVREQVARDVARRAVRGRPG